MPVTGTSRPSQAKTSSLIPATPQELFMHGTRGKSTTPLRRDLTTQHPGIIFATDLSRVQFLTGATRIASFGWVPRSKFPLIRGSAEKDKMRGRSIVNDSGVVNH